MVLKTFAIVTIGLSALVSYSFYKYYDGLTKKNKKIEYSVEYSVNSYDDYTIVNPARIYKYNVPKGSYEDFETSYKKDLFGNYKKKEHIDFALQKYLKIHVIYQKRVIINTEGFVADFIIDTNVNPSTLVFDIENNSLEEAKNDF